MKEHVFLGAVEDDGSSVTGRKDSLSINLEFVKVSLSRLRRTGCPAFIDTCIASKGGKMDTTLINISGKNLLGHHEIATFNENCYNLHPKSIVTGVFIGMQ